MRRTNGVWRVNVRGKDWGQSSIVLLPNLPILSSALPKLVPQALWRGGWWAYWSRDSKGTSTPVEAWRRSSSSCAFPNSAGFQD